MWGVYERILHGCRWHSTDSRGMTGHSQYQCCKKFFISAYTTIFMTLQFSTETRKANMTHTAQVMFTAFSISDHLRAGRAALALHSPVFLLLVHVNHYPCNRTSVVHITMYLKIWAFTLIIQYVHIGSFLPLALELFYRLHIQTAYSVITPISVYCLNVL